MFIQTTLSSLKNRVEALTTWPARAVAFGLGVMAAFSMPPLYQIYLLIPAFGGLLWLITGAETRWRAFVIGWGFGAGFFAAGLYWVSFALLVDAQKFAWLIPIAMFAFGFGFGLYSAGTAWVVKAIPGDNLVGKALVLIAAWSFFEWMRGWFLTGFPWNPMGSVWAFSDAFLQSASIIGVFGLSVITMLMATLPATLAQRGRLPWILNGAVLIGLAVMWLGGHNRLLSATNDVVPGVRLRLIQPNISQAEKWKSELRTAHMMTQLDLGTAPPKPGDPAPTHIIWAETSAPFFIGRHKQWLNFVGGKTPPKGLTILGAPHIAVQDGQQDGALNVTNSLLAIDNTGTVTAQYDKFHLVPFGEYVPFKDWLPLDRITEGVGSFMPGPGTVTLNLKGLPPVSPLICYEIIFPGAVTNRQGTAQWILNLTNDAWYGRTAGPYQHFVNTRLRAVEEGLPVVRVAGTGMSGIIDGYGRVTVKLGLGEKAFIDGDLPVPARDTTLFSQFRNGPALVLMGFFAIAGIYLCRRRPHDKAKTHKK